jgi:iron complex outermembrane recepter protein
MHIAPRHQARCAGLSLVAGVAAQGCWAQQAAVPAAPASAPRTVALDRIVVIGARASLATAQQIKREAIEIVDVVVADDINKLPDFSVTDALQRITGVQIARDRGDGTATAIRGLTQMETTLNGREVFTAGTGRNLEFADIPAEMVASIHVYKTSSAEQIEGGIGGLVDLRTRRPFDFAGRESVVSARRVESNLAGAGANQFSALWSDRWQAAGTGEWGLLVNLTRQDRAWREDQKSTGAPVQRTDLLPGLRVTAPNSTSETTSIGRKLRTGGSAILQWRPNDRLDLYAEVAYAQFETRQDSYQINVSASPSFAAGSAQLFPGTTDLARITWTNAPISVLSFARDTVDRTRQAAIGGNWRDDTLTVKTDLSYAQSYNNLFFSGPVLGGTAATFTQDLSGSVPASSVVGTNLADPQNFRFSSMAYRTRPFEGRLGVGRLDLEQQLAGSWVSAVQAGYRFARRDANNTPGLIFADAAVPGNVSAASLPGTVITNPYGDFLGGGTQSLGGYVVGNLDIARDSAALRSAFGITAPIPASGSLLGLWTIREETQAGYLMATWKAAELPIDGNVGLRVVATREAVTGSRSAPSAGTGATLPVQVDSRYVDVLPSANLRYALASDLIFRVAVSKTVTRPNFDQLSPSVTLLRNSVVPTLNQGSAGNPELKPVRSRNLDLALEHYLSATASSHATVFVKRVDGFVTTVSSPEVYDGETYQVSRPANGSTGGIRGLEIGYQRFFAALPGAWRGLGLQANYTYVDGETHNPMTDTRLPLQNLSRQSGNLIGLYELGPVSARLAYNWRSRFFSGTTNVTGLGSLNIYTRGYGWLDASLRYRANPHLTLALEGNNLLATRRVSYYGVETRPQSVWANDVQIGVSATLRF